MIKNMRIIKLFVIKTNFYFFINVILSFNVLINKKILIKMSSSSDSGYEILMVYILLQFLHPNVWNINLKKVLHF